MSTRTINFTHRVGGILTDVTVALLSDPTGTFGVKRNDTSAVVVLDGTAMTRLSAGTYQHIFTEPASGLSYTSYVEWTYAGVTHRAENSLTLSLDVGCYVTQAYMELIRGAENIRKWSRKGGSSTTDAAAVEAAIVSACMIVETVLRSVYVLPLIGASDADNNFLRWATERLASYELYIGRGLQEDDATGNMLLQQRDEVWNERGDGLLQKYAEPGTSLELDAEKLTTDLPRVPYLVV